MTASGISRKLLKCVFIEIAFRVKIKNKNKAIVNTTATQTRLSQGANKNSNRHNAPRAGKYEWQASTAFALDWLTMWRQLSEPQSQVETQLKIKLPIVSAVSRASPVSILTCTPLSNSVCTASRTPGLGGSNRPMIPRNDSCCKSVPMARAMTENKHVDKSINKN